MNRSRTDEAGATDPILVIAAIAVSLVLLVGGSFAVAGIISNGKDLNAKSDLDRVATAEDAAVADESGQFWAYDSHPDSEWHALQSAAIGFTPSEGGRVVVDVNLAGQWLATSYSGTGKVFLRSSLSKKIVEISPTAAATLPADLDTPAGLGQSVVNAMRAANVAGDPYDFASNTARPAADVLGRGGKPGKPGGPGGSGAPADKTTDATYASVAPRFVAYPAPSLANGVTPLSSSSACLAYVNTWINRWRSGTHQIDGSYDFVPWSGDGFSYILGYEDQSSTVITFTTSTSPGWTERNRSGPSTISVTNGNCTASYETVGGGTAQPYKVAWNGTTETRTDASGKKGSERLEGGVLVEQKWTDPTYGKVTNNIQADAYGQTACQAAATFQSCWRGSTWGSGPKSSMSDQTINSDTTPASITWGPDGKTVEVIFNVIAADGTAGSNTHAVYYAWSGGPAERAWQWKDAVFMDEASWWAAVKAG